MYTYSHQLACNFNDLILLLFNSGVRENTKAVGSFKLLLELTQDIIITFVDRLYKISLHMLIRANCKYRLNCFLIFYDIAQGLTFGFLFLKIDKSKWFQFERFIMTKLN